MCPCGPSRIVADGAASSQPRAASGWLFVAQRFSNEGTPFARRCARWHAAGHDLRRLRRAGPAAHRPGRRRAPAASRRQPRAHPFHHRGQHRLSRDPRAVARAQHGCHRRHRRGAAGELFVAHEPDHPRADLPARHRRLRADHRDRRVHRPPHHRAIAAADARRLRSGGGNLNLRVEPPRVRPRRLPPGR